MNLKISREASDSIFDYFRHVNSKRYNVLCSALSGMVILVVLAVQALPYFLAHPDMDLSEVTDFGETESDEKDTEEKEKRAEGDSDFIKDDSGTLFGSNFHFLYWFPIPPNVEKHSPPPDLVC